MGDICAVLCFEGAASGVVQPAGWRSSLDTPYAIPAIAALWTGIERTHGTFGFAWLTLGNAAIDMPLPLRVAPFAGVYGISFLFAMMSAVVALLILRRGRQHLYWLAIVPALLLLPELPARETPAETALVVQPNIDPETEWTYESLERGERALDERIAGSRADSIIWPESPAPFYFYRDPRFRQDAMQLAQIDHAYFLFGTVAETTAERATEFGCAAARPTAGWSIATTRSTWCRSANTCRRSSDW